MNNTKLLMHVLGCVAMLLAAISPGPGAAQEQTLQTMIYDPGQLKPVDSVLKVKVGDPAPPLSLPSLTGETVSLAQYRGTHNVVISFVPAAWTPVCSDQWPGYNIVRDVFVQHDAILLGITVDNLPTLHAWTRQMGELWFPVLSDFWPHGEAAGRFGVLRTDGTAERALFIIDKAGIIRFITVSDINRRPNLKDIVGALQAIQ
ncbi:peroxiredoxin [Desulfosarcina sp.]|uniref:peroxiredoxin n=1 Tax=Desulfosarcina sp. TaxID=2027861 RepID=UPI0029A404C6|nr:peroxiredoxin [Desulfosarcina sp.]MDX2454516.1 peroxiredoxin [Desulfosarcina sp.]MDX2492151.1 peroxiredoxin [Desulfosarcina sp.]